MHIQYTQSFQLSCASPLWTNLTSTFNFNFFISFDSPQYPYTHHHQVDHHAPSISLDPSIYYSSFQQLWVCSQCEKRETNNNNNNNGRNKGDTRVFYLGFAVSKSCSGTWDLPVTLSVITLFHIIPTSTPCGGSISH